MSDVITEYYRAVDNEEIDAVLNLFTTDTVYERPGYAPMRGRSALEHFYREERVITSGKHEIDRVLADGDDRVALGRFRGVLRDGREADVHFADHFSLTRDDRIARRRTYFYTSAV